MKTLILGIGNSILGDDGVGVKAARELARLVKDKNTDVTWANVDGLNLLDFILEYDRLIVIDAMVTERGEVGEIYRLKPEQTCPPSGSAISPHHFNLVTTLEIGKKLFPNRMPGEVTVYAVGTQEAAKVTEEMTDAVETAIPKVVAGVLEEIKRLSG
jgi:hydrogenase maturation protease